MYADTLQHVSRLCRHIWTPAGIRLICRPGRYSYIPVRPNLGQPTQSQPLSLCLSSLLTLPGIIPPTVVPAGVPAVRARPLEKIRTRCCQIETGIKENEKPDRGLMVVLVLTVLDTCRSLHAGDPGFQIPRGTLSTPLFKSCSIATLHYSYAWEINTTNSISLKKTLFRWIRHAHISRRTLTNKIERQNLDYIVCTTLVLIKSTWSTTYSMLVSPPICVN
jgi:hypothetical protein